MSDRSGKVRTEPRRTGKSNIIQNQIMARRTRMCPTFTEANPTGQTKETITVDGDLVTITKADNFILWAHDMRRLIHILDQAFDIDFRHQTNGFNSIDYWRLGCICRCGLIQEWKGRLKKPGNNWNCREQFSAVGGAVCCSLIFIDLPDKIRAVVVWRRGGD